MALRCFVYKEDSATMLRLTTISPESGFATAQDYLAYQISFLEGIEENAQ